MPINPQSLGNDVGRLALGSAPGYLLAQFNREPRSAILMPLALARAMPALVRSLIFCASTFAKDESGASRIFRTNSLSVERCGSVKEWNETPYEVNRWRWAIVCAIPSRLNWSKAQNNTQSNFRLAASSNRAANCLRFSAPFRPLSASTYSRLIVWPESIPGPQFLELVLRVLALIVGLRPGHRWRHAGQAPFWVREKGCFFGGRRGLSWPP